MYAYHIKTPILISLDFTFALTIHCEVFDVQRRITSKTAYVKLEDSAFLYVPKLLVELVSIDRPAPFIDISSLGGTEVSNNVVCANVNNCNGNVTLSFANFK
jgi:hypothetical protein